MFPVGMQPMVLLCANFLLILCLTDQLHEIGVLPNNWFYSSFGGIGLL